MSRNENPSLHQSSTCYFNQMSGKQKTILSNESIIFGIHYITGGERRERKLQKEFEKRLDCNENQNF